MDISDEIKTARTAALAKTLAGGTLCFRAGSKPASCADAASGAEIASLALPGNAVVRGTEATMIGAPVRALATARGVPGYWRVEKAGKCVLQGAVAEAFPEMTQEIEQGQMIEIRSWVIADGVN